MISSNDVARRQRARLRPRRGDRLLMRRPVGWACCSLLAVVLGVAAVSPARADGDPASDYLYTQSAFVPYDAGPNSPAAQTLTALTQAAKHSGYPLRVAVIASTYDLGSVTALWRKPKSYARFLGTELAYVYRGALLVVMPNGFGFYDQRHGVARELDQLRSVRIDSGSDGLTKTAITAVRRLASAAGHPLTLPHTPKPAPEQARPSTRGNRWFLGVLVALVAAAVAIAVAALWRRGRAGRALAAAIGAAVLVGVLVGVVLAMARPAPSPSTAATIDRHGAPTWAVNLMGLLWLDRKTAPSFSLVDQRGRRISLTGLRGRVIVLEFMDSRCTNLCPIISHEYVQAAKRLGAKMPEVEFVAINVNDRHERIHDVAAFSRKYGLSGLAHWHFLTGSTPALKKVWRSYGVTVADGPSGLVHGVNMYFIDPGGKLDWLATPNYDQALINRWGQGIAGVARTLIS